MNLGSRSCGSSVSPPSYSRQRRPDHPGWPTPKILAALIPSARLHVYNSSHLELVTRPDPARAPSRRRFLTRQPHAKHVRTQIAAP